mmetsp:Transcript_85508/g.191127  ORF Transcript_85508/g.191127 Transcript_85508/m.191127 type:complete len:535 (-) Transcript_85508:27-1631(-)
MEAGSSRQLAGWAAAAGSAKSVSQSREGWCLPDTSAQHEDEYRRWLQASGQQAMQRSYMPGSGPGGPGLYPGGTSACQPAMPASPAQPHVMLEALAASRSMSLRNSPQVSNTQVWDPGPRQGFQAVQSLMPQGFVEQASPFGAVHSSPAMGYQEHQQAPVQATASSSSGYPEGTQTWTSAEQQQQEAPARKHRHRAGKNRGSGGHRHKLRPPHDVPPFAAGVIGNRGDEDESAIAKQEYGQEEQEEQSKDLLRTLHSLYEDKLEPFDRHVLRRHEELTHTRWTFKQLKHIAELTEGVQFYNRRGDVNTFYLYLADEPRDGFVEQSSLEDNYPPEVWAEFRQVLSEFDGGEGLARSRYECAQLLQRKMPSLASRPLGEVCHIVQLAVKSKFILGYRSGQIVPYYASEDYEKFMHAECQCFLSECAAETSPEQSTVTWEELGPILERLLRDLKFDIGLSRIKDLIHSREGKVLSEAALGCTSLKNVLQDSRLEPYCWLEWNGTEIFVRPSRQQEGLQPAMEPLDGSDSVAGAPLYM